MILSEEQLNNLNKEALVIIVASLQDQLSSMQTQLDTANRQLSDTNRQIELLTEQIRIMNQRKFGRKAESGLLEGQLTLFDSFNEVEATSDDKVPDPEISEMIIASYRRKKSVGKRYNDNGINLATNTMANWVIKSADNYLSLVYDRLHQLIYDNHVIHADETSVKVMRIDDNKVKNGKKTYMWVYRNRPTDESHPIVLFDWQPSRKADHPREFLKNFSGTVITEIMHIDNGFDDLPSCDRFTQRQLVLTEKVDAYFAWVKQKYAQVARNSTIGKALAYSIHQEPYLRTFLNDGNIPMDNNYAEQAIRPFTIGRKNFVLIESSNGARASAMIYSLVETAKANHLNVYQYFELLLTEIPKHMNDTSLDFIDDLLPWTPSVQETCPSRFKKS